MALPAACMLYKNNPTQRRFFLKNKNTQNVYKQCPNTASPYLIGDGQEKRIIAKSRCGKWTCPYCADLNRNEHYNRIAYAIDNYWRKGYEMEFVTITCHEKWRGSKRSVENWRKNKDKLLARYRRKYVKEYGEKPHFVYIAEYHKDETVHIHGVFFGALGTRWYKDNARESGLGYMAESAKLNSVLQAVNYCLKYITKEMGKPVVTKGFRRINYSRGFYEVKKNVSPLEWSVLDNRQSIENAIAVGVLDGKVVKFDGKEYKSLDDLHP